MATSQTPRLSEGRVALWALAGWGIPCLLTAPLATQHESSGGESALAFGIAWLFVAGPIGSLIAGARIGWLGRRANDRTGAFVVGFGLSFIAILPVFIVDAMITVLEVGPAAFLLVLPILVAYLFGFAIGVVLRP